MKQKKNTDWEWNKKGSLIYGSIVSYYFHHQDFVAKPLVLGFDMDETLISTKSGAKFAKDANDWKWWDTKVTSTI